MDTRKIIAVKVVILGSQGVGKTSLVTRYESKSFNQSTSSTIGASFSNAEILVDGTRVKMQIWDTAGQERFRAMAPMYYRNADAAVLVFDLTNYSTFTDVKAWVHELHSRVGEDLMLVVVGNKKDLTEDREVNAATAKEYASSIGAPFVETSALENKGVQEAFNIIAAEMVKRANSDANSSLRVYSPDGNSPRSRSPSQNNVQLNQTPQATGQRGGCC